MFMLGHRSFLLSRASARPSRLARLSVLVNHVDASIPITVVQAHRRGKLKVKMTPTAVGRWTKTAGSGKLCVERGDAAMEEKVREVLDEIRPALQAHEGDVELLSVEEDGTVHVRLTGGCAGCPYSQMTLTNGIERILKEKVPGVQQVVAG
jgi:Fe-S cluster biogenesis protein NfuA